MCTARTGLLLFAGVIAACAGSANAAVVSIVPNHDNTMYSESNNSNGAGTALFAGDTNSNGGIRRALISFDIASKIPANATINSVSLTLTVNKSGASAAAEFELHPLTDSWGEGTSIGSGAGGAPTPGDATWNYRLYSNSTWTTAGGDFGATSGTTTIGFATNTAYTFPSQPGMVEDVQNWLDNPAANFGWLLKASDEVGLTARQFASRESTTAAPPTLTIDYSTVPEPGIGLEAMIASLLAWCLGRNRPAPTH